MGWYWESFFFFYQGFETGNSQDSRGREETIFYSVLPLPPAHEHPDIYLQLCMWDDYHCISQAATRWNLPSYRITIWLVDDMMLSFVACWFDFRFCYSCMTWETGGHELASIIILVLQANQLTKCASQSSPNVTLTNDGIRKYYVVWEQQYPQPKKKQKNPECYIFKNFQLSTSNCPLKHQYLLETSYIKVIPMISSIH